MLAGKRARLVEQLAEIQDSIDFVDAKRSQAECIARIGIPISTVFTGKSVPAIEPSVLPPRLSERFTKRW